MAEQHYGRSLVVMAGMVLALLLASCGSDAGGAGPRTIPLRTSFYYSASNGLPVIRVVIGDDQPVDLLFDTGSVGIRVYAQDLPTGPASGIRTTTQGDRALYEGGMTLNGLIAYASVDIDGLRTRPIPFEIVQSCVGGCGGSLRGSGAGPISGIFGAGIAGPSRGDPPVNALQELPGRYGKIWSVRATTPASADSTGTLVLGASPPVHLTQTISLQPLSSVRAEPRYWDDLPEICWSFGSARQYCFPTSFDTGSDSMIIQAQDLPPQLPAGANAVVAPGMTIKAYQDGSSQPFWQYDTGDQADFDLAISNTGTPAYVNSGIQAFQTLNVTYDTVTGQLMLAAT